jgi:hypothetical protein
MLINLKKRAGGPVSLSLFSGENTSTHCGRFFRVSVQQSKNKNVTVVEHVFATMTVYRLSPEDTI